MFGRIGRVWFIQRVVARHGLREFMEDRKSVV